MKRLHGRLVPRLQPHTHPPKKASGPSEGPPIHMRVAYVSADPGVPAFANRADSLAIRDVCVAMLDHGFDLSLFLANRGGAPPAKLASVPVTDLRAPIAGDPDTHTCDTLAFNGDTAAALARSGPFDIIYERAARWSAAPMHYAARRSAPGILQLGAALVRELADDTTPHALATRALLKSALCSAHLVIAPCDEVAATARTLAEDKANIHIVPDGCDPRTLAQSADSHHSGDFVIGYVGSLAAGAGLEVLVDAVATLVATRVPHAKLLIVGDGPGRNDLARRAARRGLTQAVTFTSAGADDLPDLLAKMRVAVAPQTLAPTTPPAAITECMAAGLPVVASAHPTFAAIVGHDTTGLLFRPGDAAGLASALGQLHADPLRRRHLGHQARSYAAGHFTWRRTLEQILSLAAALPRAAARG